MGLGYINGGHFLNIKKLKWMVGVIGLSSVNALAGVPSSDVKVTGEIASSRCEIIAPNNGVYDFGKIKLPTGSDNPVSLPDMTQSWRVKCDNATYLEVIPQDNRNRAANGISTPYFSLGGNGVHTLGNYRLGVSNAQIDRAVAMSQTAGQAQSRSGVMPLIPGMRTRWLMPENVMRAGRVFSLDITVSPRLTIPQGAVTEAVSLDGSVTLDFIFGI
ncbi:hypothetical protein [Serratia sp. 2723]|uniref:hypothetical protein n=1 Tax=unclassified Serratia (in: enterobacteria) TaxID=2647522 RepID=UPI003D215403